MITPRRKLTGGKTAEMSQVLKDLSRSIEEFYLTSTGRLSYSMCQTMLESEYPAFEEEIKRLAVEDAGGVEAESARLKEARDNLVAQIERYESINQRWNQKFSTPDLRRSLS
jgi:hypothetical protein